MNETTSGNRGESSPVDHGGPTALVTPTRPRLPEHSSIPAADEPRRLPVERRALPGRPVLNSSAPGGGAAPAGAGVAPPHEMITPVVAELVPAARVAAPVQPPSRAPR